MEEEYYIKLQKHSIVLTNNNQYNQNTDEYETFPKTISKIIHFVNRKYPLYIYYLDNYNRKHQYSKYVIVNKLLKRDIIAFEPIELNDFDNEYLAERFLVGSHNIKEILENIKFKKYDSVNKLENFLEKNCDILCKIYDSSYLELKSQDSTIIDDIYINIK